MGRRRDRVAAWVLTGPVGRVVAFVGDLIAAVAAAVSTKLRRS